MNSNRRTPQTDSEPGDEAAEIPGECPQCKSKNVAILVDPKTCKLVTYWGHTGLKCADCAKYFTADYIQTFAVISQRKPSMIIEEDLNCPRCKGPLRGQRAGKACAGCGEMIPEHLCMSRAWVRQKLGLFGWMAVIAFIVAIGVFAILKFL